MANAQETVNGIIVTFDGAETSYKLEEVPTIKYETVEGVEHAVFYLKDVEEPVLTVPLAEGKKITVIYGEYVPPTPTGIDNVAADKAHITVQNGKKLIKGGKIVIIAKDGKMYDAAGLEIKK